jgi:hypothetical protein
VSNSDEKLRLRIEPATPLTEVTLTDSRFRKIALPTNTGEIEIELARGVYQVGFRDGRSIEQKLVVLSPGQTSPEVVTATARPRSAADDEDADEEAALPDPPSLTVRVRDALDDALDDESLSPPPSPSTRIAGLSLLKQDGTPAPAGQPSIRANSTHLEFDVEPGYYRLRLETGIKDQVFETPIVVCPGWRIRISCRTRWYGKECRCDFSTAQLRMSRAGSSYRSSPDERDLEANAIASLAGGRTLSGTAFNGLLRGKPKNPMLGFYAGYLLRGGDPGAIDTLAAVVENLTNMIEPPPGLLHPDLEALKLRLKLLPQEQIEEQIKQRLKLSREGQTEQDPELEALRQQLKRLREQQIDETPELPLPPMLLASWRTILQVAANSTTVVPKGSLADRISCRLVAAGASMTWTAEQVVAAAPVAEAAAGPRTVSFGTRTLRGARRSARGVSAGSESAPMALPVEEAGAVLDSTQGAAFIGKALSNSRLRDWFRRAAGLASGGDDESYSGATPPFSDAERIVATAIHPIAPKEKFQEVFEKMRSASSSSRLPPTPSTLAQQLRIPLTSVERAIEEVCGKLRRQAQILGINLQG